MTTDLSNLSISELKKIKKDEQQNSRKSILNIRKNKVDYWYNENTANTK